MIRSIFTALIFFLSGTLSAAESETERLEQMVALMEKTVTQAKTLKQEIERYLKIQEAYIARPDDRDRCFTMVKTAGHLLYLIEDAHLEQAVSPKLLEELTLFANMSKKRGLPRP